MKESTHFYSDLDIVAGGAGCVFQAGTILLSETAKAVGLPVTLSKRSNHAECYWPFMSDKNPLGPGLVPSYGKGRPPDVDRLRTGLLDGDARAGDYKNRAT